MKTILSTIFNFVFGILEILFIFTMLSLFIHILAFFIFPWAMLPAAIVTSALLVASKNKQKQD